MKKIFKYFYCIFFLAPPCLCLGGEKIIPDVAFGVKAIRIILNYKMVQEGAWQSAKWYGSDDSYLAGYFAANSAEALAFIYSNSQGLNRPRGRLLFMAASVIACWHGGVNDARMWTHDRSQLHGWKAPQCPAYIIAGSLFEMFGPSIALRYWNPSKKSQAICSLVAANLIGTVVWDRAFASIRYHDQLFPVKNWYNGWGFKNKAERVRFDIARLALGAIFYLFPEIISDNNKFLLSINNRGLQINF